MRRYQCPACGATYTHDQGYWHAVRECPARARRGAVSLGLALVLLVGVTASAWQGPGGFAALRPCQVGEIGHWLGVVVGPRGERLVLVLTERNGDPHTARCRVGERQRIVAATAEAET